MARCPCKEIFDPQEVNVLHVWLRTARQRHTFGRDREGDQDCTHRRDWAEDLPGQLVTLFAIEIGFQAHMGNHYHLLLRNRPDVAES